LDASGWHLEVVDSEGGVGRYTSLALDRQGYPHIGYQDYLKGDLKYAYQDASGWHVETVDTGGAEGRRYTSLTMDKDDHPHISYYDWDNGDLKYAYQNATGWHIQVVESEGQVGRYTSIALGEDGYPHISYYDDAQGDLRYTCFREPAGIRLEIVAFYREGDQTVTIEWLDPTDSAMIEHSPTLVPVDSQTIAGPVSGSSWTADMPVGASTGFYRVTAE
jgi:catechol 2,3-dioxygenase-like lactoylglutathione lyase family enzyme